MFLSDVFVPECFVNTNFIKFLKIYDDKIETGILKTYTTLISKHAARHGRNEVIDLFKSTRFSVMNN